MYLCLWPFCCLIVQKGASKHKLCQNWDFLAIQSQGAQGAACSFWPHLGSVALWTDLQSKQAESASAFLTLCENYHSFTCFPKTEILFSHCAIRSILYINFIYFILGAGEIDQLIRKSTCCQTWQPNFGPRTHSGQRSAGARSLSPLPCNCKPAQ